jgi:hypothetical protein
MLGQEVATIANERVEAKLHEVRFDTSTLPSGICVYRLQVGEFISFKKLLLFQ